MIKDTVHLLDNFKTTRVNQIQRYEEEEVAFMENANQRGGGGGNGVTAKKSTKAKARKEKDRVAKIVCFNCGKKGNYKSDCRSEKKEDDAGAESDGAGIDALNFDEFNDDESCESGKDMFNLCEL